MNFRNQAVSLSLFLAVTIGTLAAPSAEAGLPIFPGINMSVRFTDTLKSIYSLDAKEQKRLFNLKNAKGESIFHGAQMQKDLWATLDPATDQVEGTSTEKLYGNFKIPESENEIIVAVIDSGVDINHEDLKGHMWINLPEFYGKPGVNDDGDGYIDDIYGWNFLGNKDGTNVGASTFEVTRIYAKLKAEQAAGQILNATDTALFNEVSLDYTNELADATKGLARYEDFDAAIKLLKANGLKDETLAGLSAVTSVDPTVLKAIQLAKIVYTHKLTSADITDGLTHFNTEMNYNLNLSFNPSDIIKDDPNNLTEKGYGNGDVIGPDASHGTHVAGIIGALRNNFGINGQASNVKIMPIRAIPDGDERDKDVANAVRFAVDHGARVINMSFGKAYSPNKPLVDEAMKYAEASGVLLVHAAGNDNLDTSTQAHNFPNRKIEVTADTTRDIQTWLEVGASSRTKGVTLPADFSNYSKTAVDLFAPGVDIVSTIPGNQYASYSGTSMASPETAGVAALLLERYPFATAIETKNAIMNSTNQYAGLSCDLPGTAANDDGTPPTMVNFSNLSITGGTLNAYQAMLQMEKLGY
jgi:cell wall-associated protease